MLETRSLMLKQIVPRHTSNRDRTIGRFGLGLFSLAFSIPGLAIAIGIAANNWQCYRQTDWKVVGAEVLSLPQQASDLSDEGALQYRYSFEGQTIVVRAGEEHLPSFLSNGRKSALHQRAAQVQASRTTIPCWVNPIAPAEHTLLPRQPSRASLFLGIFTFSHGLVGLLLFFAKAMPSGAQTPGQSNSSAGRHRWIWLLATLLCLNAFAIPSALSLGLTAPALAESDGAPSFMEDAIPPWLAWILVLLPVLPFRIWWRAGRKQQLERDLHLSYPSGGLRPGSEISLRLSQTDGGFILPNALQNTSAWVLRCIEQSEAAAQGGDQASALTLASVPLQAAVEVGTIIRLSGALPPDALPSSDGIRWELSGKAPGALKLGPFIIPVQASEQPKAVGSADYGTAQITSLLDAAGIQHQRTVGGEEVWDFPGNRFPSVATTLRVVLIILAAALLGLVFYFSTRPFSFTIGGAFITLFVTAIVVAVASVMHDLNLPRRVTLSRAGLIYSGKSVLKSFERHHELSLLGDFDGLATTIVNGRPYFHVEVELGPPAKRTVISPLFPSQASAEAFAQTLAAAVERLRG